MGSVRGTPIRYSKTEDDLLLKLVTERRIYNQREGKMGLWKEVQGEWTKRVSSDVRPRTWQALQNRHSNLTRGKPQPTPKVVLKRAIPGGTIVVPRRVKIENVNLTNHENDLAEAKQRFGNLLKSGPVRIKMESPPSDTELALMERLIAGEVKPDTNFERVREIVTKACKSVLSLRDEREREGDLKIEGHLIGKLETVNKRLCLLDKWIQMPQPLNNNIRRMLKERFSAKDSSKATIGRLRDEESRRESEIRMELEKCKKDAKELKELTQNIYKVLDTPEALAECDPEGVRDFWAKIIGKELPWTESSLYQEWKKHVKEANLEGKEGNLAISDAEWEEIIRNTDAWKAAGPDSVPPGMWLYVPTANREVRKWIEEILNIANQPDSNRKMEKLRRLLRAEVCKGNVTLLHKGGDNAPENFRPIACLNSCYKLLTSTLRMKLSTITERVIPREQMALRKGATSGIEAAICTDVAITMASQGEGCTKRYDTYVGYVDFSKAFDSINHKYLWSILEVVGAHRIKTILKIASQEWKLSYKGFQDNRVTMSAPLKIKRGVMQGDSLSPLLFCIAISPFSWYLNTRMQGLSIRNKTNGGTRTTHIYYMDDLKLYSSKLNDIETGLALIKNEGEAVGLFMNAKKSATGTLWGQETRQRVDLATIPHMDENDTYKYLGFKQGEKDQNLQNLTEATDRFCQKVQTIWKTNASFREKVIGTNSIATAMMNYALQGIRTRTGTYEQFRNKVKDVEDLIRKTMIEERAIPLKSTKTRLFAPQNEGGIGLQSLVEKADIATARAWITLQEADMATFKQIHAASRSKNLESDFRKLKDLYKFKVDRDKTTWKLVHADETADCQDLQELCKNITKLLIEESSKASTKEWQNSNTMKTLINSGISTRSWDWIKRGSLRSQDVNNLLAVQELTLTGSLKIVNQNGDKKCRRCKERDESVQHIICACPSNLHNTITNRHNAVADWIWFDICKQYGVDQEAAKRKIKAENSRVVIYYNRLIFKDKYNLKSCKPDILLIIKDTKQAFIIEVGITWVTRIEEQLKRKTYKYGINGEIDETTSVDTQWPAGNNLRRCISRDWGLKTTLIPVILGCCGEVTGNSLKEMRKLPNWKEQTLEIIQERVIKGTSNIVRCHLAN